MNNPTLSEKYTDAGNSLRHYSGCVLKVRSMTIVQGLIVLGAEAVLYSKGEFFYLLIVTIFGLIFTFILYLVHTVYIQDFESILNWVVETEGESGPWMNYNMVRNNRLGKTHTNTFFHYGVFVLLGFSCFSILVMAGIKLCHG